MPKRHGKKKKNATKCIAGIKDIPGGQENRQWAIQEAS